MAVLTRLDVPGPPDAWRTLGFDAGTEGFRAGAVLLRPGARSIGWAFDALVGDAGVLAVPTTRVPAPDGPAPAHPNRVVRVDHVVYTVPSLDAAIGAIGAVLRIEPRRRGTPRPGGPEMAFYRAGEAVIEVVASGAGPALWGVMFRSDDLDATIDAVRAAGGEVGAPKPAIQGGRIASVPKDLTGMPLAFLER